MNVSDTPEYAILRLKDQIAGNRAVLAAYRLGPLSERGLRTYRFVETEQAQLEEELRLLELGTLDNKYDPNQPRVPAGNSDGGQWSDAGGSGGGIGVSPQGNLPDAIARPRTTETARRPVILAGNSGMPGDNVRANKQVGSICSALKLTKDQRRELHSAVSGQNLSYQEIKLLAIQMFCN
ncbi:hypothetical protein [Phyllobacterium endophyticum]|uniref:hypothetical protein n=1 Tax=Phyllobacterium endophyticum TaxID=1149773 RepID=UPI0011CAFEBD|nr:hypothetical protein [Phyllobacterium endophyticum]TXR48982.1 hypothetical protein FVA77_11845 [Phyllobacterium endophyticum]